MPRNGTKGMCCGAGGARMWMEETVGDEGQRRARRRRRCRPGASRIATACPFCYIMLDDGTKAVGAGDDGEGRPTSRSTCSTRSRPASASSTSRPSPSPPTLPGHCEGIRRDVGLIPHCDAGSSQPARVAGMPLAPSARRDDAEHLVHVDPAVGEADRRAGHVQPPHPRPPCADEADRLVPVRLQVGDPRPQRPGVVLAQRLDVADLEAGLAPSPSRTLADVDQLTVGEHVAADERRPPHPRSADRADRVVEQPTLRAAGRRGGSL